MNYIQSNAVVPSYIPSQWGKEEMLQAFLEMKDQDEILFETYFGQAQYSDLQQSLQSVQFKGLCERNRKNAGGFEFDVVLDHSYIPQDSETRVLHHTVIVSPEVKYLEDTEIVIYLSIDILDGRYIDD